MELHPTPRSWRIALVTAVGAFAVVAVAAVLAAQGGGIAWLWAAVCAAAVATFLPAVGTLTARVEVDSNGVVVRRLGRAQAYRWDAIVAVDTIERRGSVPDGTEYHWVLPARRAHVVVVPCLRLTTGAVRQLPALSAPAAERHYADDCARELERFRAPATPRSELTGVS